MDFKDIILDINRQIRELQTAKKTLRKLAGGMVGNGRRGRKMSAAGRARIAAAQRKRWAKLRLVKKRA